MKRIKLFAIAMILAGFVSAQKNTIHVPGDYEKIQDAINAAITDDVVLVDEGIYFESIDFKGKAITVRSHFDPNSPDSSLIFNTIIDGSQPSNPDSASIVFFISDEGNTSVLRGFTIQGGTGSPGSGGGKSGGGIFIKEAGPVIEHNIISNNHCEEGGDFVSGGGIFIYNSYGYSTIIRHNLIDSNTCVNSKEGYLGATGGGISAVFAGECIIHDNIITNNYVLHDINKGYAVGGGIECYSTKGIISDNTISNNTAETTVQYYYPWGGGIYSWSLKEGSTISGNLISNNVITGSDSKGGGIGILDNSGKITIDKNIIKDNWAKYGSGITIRVTADVSFTNNLFKGNYAQWRGGGIYIRQPSDKDALVDPHTSLHSAENNTNLKSGKDVSIEVINNTFHRDTAVYGGAAIYYDHESPLIALNNIFYENKSNPDYDILINSSSNAYLYNNLLETMRISGSWEGADNIAYDPEFEDDTCHLLGTSPCINIGAESIELNGITYFCPDHDIDGNSRPQNAGVDIGADEKTWVGIGDKKLESSINVLVCPNPVSSSTIIQYSIFKTQMVNLAIYDNTGRVLEILVNETKTPGEYKVWFNAEGLPAGIYIYSLMVGDEVVSGKIIKR